MGAALDNLRELLNNNGLSLDRKSFTTLLALVVMLILLPVGVFLVRNRTVFFPMAAGELIQLGEGGCIKLDKNKKKVVDCQTIPLKLVNPFYNIPGSSNAPVTSSVPAQSSSPQASASVAVSPSPAASVAPQTVTVSGNSNTEIQAALEQVRTSGGVVNVPAGSYAINNKVQIYSNTKLVGAGIDQTIFNAGINIDEEEAVIGNSTSEGQSNIGISGITINTHPQGSGEGIKLRNITGGFVNNVKVVGTNAGILLGFHSGRGVNNVRISNCQIINTKIYGIFLSLGENNVIDNCNVNSGGSDSLGIGLEIGVDGKISNNRVLNNTVTAGGHSYSLTAGGDNQYEPGWVNSNNIVCYNNASGNKIDPIWDQRGANNVYVGNNVAVSNVSSFGFEEKGGTDARCDIPASYNISSSTSQPTIADSSSWVNKLIGEVFAQDSDDNFTGTTFNDSDDNFTGSPAPSGSSSSGSGSGMVRYRLAESQAGLTSAQWRDFALVPTKSDMAKNGILGWFDRLFSIVYAQDSDDNFTGTTSNDSDDNFTGSASPGSGTGPVSGGNPTFSVGKQFILTNYQLFNATPGTKQIWVQFMHPDGSTRVDNVTFQFVDRLPQISGLTCNLDISKQNLKITVDGNYFGNTAGKISLTPSGTAEVLNWGNNQIIGSLKSPNISITEGQRYTIKVARPDGFESGTAVCAVNKSLVSFGARIFCREPGKFDASDVAITLVYTDEANNNATKKVEEKVTISAAGEIANLKTQLQAGKNYSLSIKAPNSLRRVTTFTASEGTSQITRPDGTPFILPIGDIAPVILVDGHINTLDRAELIRQWRILGQGQNKVTGDFNRDGKVNSIDWACMQFDFGSSDDPLPAEIAQPASGTIKIQQPASNTITIPVRTPSPSVSSDNSGSVIFKEEYLS